MESDSDVVLPEEEPLMRSDYGTDDDRFNYITQLKEIKQDYLINKRAMNASTVLLYTWTHRTTSCDVISTVTTIKPMKNGNMKDIKMYNKEMRRIKAPGKKPGLNLYVSPLEGGATDSNSRSRKLCNDILKNEKVMFMNRLQKSRYQRTTLENIAAILIQKIFRGYWIRSHKQLIQLRSRMQLYMRRAILTSSTIPSLSQYRQQSRLKYHSAALTIQCSYRCYISRIYIHRKRYEHFHLRRNQSVIRIQSLVRQKIGYETVKIKREKNILFLKYKAALLIQSIYRKVLAKRKLFQRRFKLQWLAARIIQTAFRGRNTRQSFALYKAIIQRIKLFKASRSIQCLVRKKIAKQRVKRLKMRRLYSRIFRATVRIQTLIRRFLGKVAMRKQRILCEEQREVRRIREEEREKESLAQQTKALSDSMDVYLQAQLGIISQVDSLVHHEMEAGNEAYCREMDHEGNTVLSIAVRYGHQDLVRKCLLWGYDLNHVNQMGESVIAIAAEKLHYEILLYLLSYLPPSNHPPTSTPSEKLDLSDEDAGVVITALAKASDLKFMRAFLEKHPNKVNAVHPINECLAIHVACELGNVDMAHLLLRHGSQVDLVDDLGQLPIHKACASSSLEVVRLLLGFSDVDYSTIRCTSNFHRNELLLKTDADGKDALLLAVLHGRTEVMKYLLTIIDSNKRKQALGDISWSAGDLLLANALAEEGNVECLKMLLDSGYDLSWAPETTGVNALMAACAVGKIRMIDYLLEKGCDLSSLDNEGRNSFHHAARCQEEAVIPYLLSCGNKAPSSCNLSANLLLVQDKSGLTPVHVIAQYGTSLSFELLAQEQLETAMSLSDYSGKTPLAVACDFNQTNAIKQLLSLGSQQPQPQAQVDLKGKNALWYYFFPTTRDETQRLQLALNPTIENEIVKLLLQAGCSLFSSQTPRDMEALQQLHDKYRACSLDSPERRSLVEELLTLIEPADICAFEGRLSLLNLFPEMVDSETCWKLGTSSPPIHLCLPSHLLLLCSPQLSLLRHRKQQTLRQHLRRRGGPVASQIRPLHQTNRHHCQGAHQAPPDGVVQWLQYIRLGNPRKECSGAHLSLPQRSQPK
jgi:ankyrin repeat protein